ncbi:MAG: 50S ribosomal protein L25/general stress protein Ctc [Thioalkalispiraceae bacterium]|jgi:large subunit ribosomal protein L25
MSSDFLLNAELRTDTGKGASRRLRHAGKVPAILYGQNKDPMPLTFNQNELAHQVDNEAFFSHILKVSVDGKGEEQAIVKDLQRHPSRPYIMHIDLQRVSATEQIRVQVPLHFINEEKAPGVTRDGGLISHNITEVEIACLPGDLPEYIEVDLGSLEMNDIFHLTDLKLPEGTELVELTHGEAHDQAVASVHMPRAAKEETAEEGEEVAAEGGESAEPTEE